MIKKLGKNRQFLSPELAGVIILCMTLCIGFSYSQEGISKTGSTTNSYKLLLNKRSGISPRVPGRVPHQQLDQNSPPEVLKELKGFLFSLEHVEEKNSGSSFPSARGAYINSSVSINRDINREFTHIHMEPGPGSQHMTLLAKDFQLVYENGWGIKHPWSDRLSKEGLVLMMIYAPRDRKDLEEIKKIIRAAWHLALSD